MTGTTLTWLLLAAVYVVFLAWYGGRGRPMTRQEIDAFLAAMRERAANAPGHEHYADLERLLVRDDGREFVMHNVIRYREKALYPSGYDYPESAPEADRRYGKAIVPYLLRYGSLPVFIARRRGEFVEPEGVDRWDVVAMVRYRSLRDFTRFAAAITQDRITVHKWAAIERTQIFPVRPLVSLIFVRGAVGALLALLGWLVT